jgi:hypothetical protein
VAIQDEVPMVDHEGDDAIVEVVPQTVPIEINNNESLIDREENSNRRLLMHWHHRFGPLPMKKIQVLSSMGLLPSNIAKCQIPLCQACTYGMMTRKAWRTKRKIQNIAPTTIKPGDHVSVDQLESPVPGFIG